MVIFIKKKIKRKIFNRLNKSIFSNDYTEYLTNYIVDNKSQFKTSSAPVENKHLTNDDFTIDTLDDYKKVKSFLEAMAAKNKLFNFEISDIIKFFGKKKAKIINTSKRKFEVNTKIDWNIFKSTSSWETIDNFW